MKFAVVNATPKRNVKYAACDSEEYSFTVWHETREEAVAEAKRLCAKECKEFIVLMEIGKACIQEMPVKFEEAI